MTRRRISFIRIKFTIFWTCGLKTRRGAGKLTPSEIRSKAYYWAGPLTNLFALIILTIFGLITSFILKKYGTFVNS
ncbi:hypothetical protein C1I38_05535 [Dehalobacter sp. 12DCB1]|nr:hypothetical protein C1I36_00150 [Dehalobacter sp. 14DCB1]TCX54223.1 hypothetical protein C1I38_05535 [Dehalobacter sp. 12DCB1]